MHPFLVVEYTVALPLSDRMCIGPLGCQYEWLNVCPYPQTVTSKAVTDTGNGYLVIMDLAFETFDSPEVVSGCMLPICPLYREATFSSHKSFYHIIIVAHFCVRECLCISNGNLCLWICLTFA